MDDEKIIGLYIISLLVLLLLGIMAIKWRDTSDKLDRLEKVVIEQTIEQPTTQETTELLTEPSDDKIVIEIRKEYKGGVYH